MPGTELSGSNAANDASKLCVGCGLCCDGTLFADVELAGAREALEAEAMGLEVEESDERRGGAVLVQPCAALRGRRCSVYEFRPKCCRTFECGLLQRVKRGWVSLAEAEARVAEVILKIAKVRGIRLGVQGGDDRKTLEQERELEELIRETFLTGGERK
jgi:Fe-S-cluster containining protein